MSLLPNTALSVLQSTFQHQGNPLDGVAGYRFVLVVAARSSRYAMPSMLDGVADFGAERIRQRVQERQCCLDVEPFGVDESVQT